jgi:RNA polymerase sigma-70 factor (ECF subfamily)
VDAIRPSSEDPLNASETPEYGAASMQCEATRLMLAVKRGDGQAFDELVKHLRGKAFHVARSLVGSRDDAMELSQEAFLKVYKARDSFREGEPFLPWFHRILRNTCFSFLRDPKRGRTRSISARGPEIDEDAPDMDLLADAPGPVAQLEGDERARAFWAAFQALPGRDREILGMRHFQELSYREIAATLAIPEGTVMSRLFHARRRLRENLRGSVLDDFDAEGFDQPRGRGPRGKA